MFNINSCLGIYIVAPNNITSSHFLGTKCLQLFSFLTNGYLLVIRVILTRFLTGLRRFLVA
jgi:hypothetical protein